MSCISEGLNDCFVLDEVAMSGAPKFTQVMAVKLEWKGEQLFYQVVLQKRIHWCEGEVRGSVFGPRDKTF